MPAISYFARAWGAPSDRGSKEVRVTVEAPGLDDRVEQAGLLRQVWVREGV